MTTCYTSILSRVHKICRRKNDIFHYIDDRSTWRTDSRTAYNKIAWFTLFEQMCNLLRCSMKPLKQTFRLKLVLQVRSFFFLKYMSIRLVYFDNSFLRVTQVRTEHKVDVLHSRIDCQIRKQECSFCLLWYDKHPFLNYTIKMLVYTDIVIQSIIYCW